MNEERAREVLKDTIQPDGHLDKLAASRLQQCRDNHPLELFEAIAWWLKNKE